MTVPTIEDFDNATLDLETVAQVSNVDYTADTTVNRSGDTVDTLGGRLKKLGFEPPIVYTGGITFSSIADNIKTVVSSGIIYAILPDEIPFTTSGSFGADSAKFYVVQVSTNTPVVYLGAPFLKVSATGSFVEFYMSVDVDSAGSSSNLIENTTNLTSGLTGRVSIGLYVAAGTTPSIVSADIGYLIEALDENHYVENSGIGVGAVTSIQYFLREKSNGNLVDGATRLIMYGT